jgi:hypothetical protein
MCVGVVSVLSGSLLVQPATRLHASTFAKSSRATRTALVSRDSSRPEKTASMASASVGARARQPSAIAPQQRRARPSRLPPRPPVRRTCKRKHHRPAVCKHPQPQRQARQPLRIRCQRTHRHCQQRPPLPLLVSWMALPRCLSLILRPLALTIRWTRGHCCRGWCHC